jgi:hypothetical protein
MGHRYHSPPSAGKLRLAGAGLGLAAVLAFGLYLPPAGYARLPAPFPAAATDAAGADTPAKVIFVREPRSPGEDEACALWDTDPSFDQVLLPMRAASTRPPPARCFTCRAPFPTSSRFKLLISTPQSSPLPVALLLSPATSQIEPNSPRGREENRGFL